jgi:hypothetical protein
MYTLSVQKNIRYKNQNGSPHLLAIQGISIKQDSIDMIASLAIGAK